MKKLFALILILVLNNSIFSQEENWITTWGLETQDVYTTDSHIDNIGNIYTVGINNNSSSDTVYSCIINKFSSVGTHQYTKSFFTGGVGANPVINSDAERNIYVYADLYIRKFSESGELLLEFPHYYTTEVTNIRIDSENNIYVYGLVDDNDNSKFGPGIFKYNPEGIEVWDFVVFPVIIPNAQTGFLTDVIMDVEDNSIITGYLTKSGNQSIFIASIDKNGLMNWQNEFSLQDKSIMQANKLARMSNGNYCVTGFCGRQYYENSYDAITISLLEDGSLSWYKIFDLDSDEDKALDIKPYNSGVVVSGLGTTDDEKTMFAVYYDVNGTESWIYSDAPKIWRDSFTFNSFPPNSTSIIVDNTDIIISGALDYGAGNSAYTSVKLNSSGELVGNIMFNSDFLGTLDNSIRLNDKAVLICSDLNGTTLDRFAKIINYDLSSITTNINESEKMPSEFSLSQNYPNPFNPTTSINYSVPSSEYVSLKVYDLLGKEVATLVNQEMNAGNYNVKFDASNFSSGIYFYTIETDKYNKTMKMLLLK